jgi:radical SAM protein with 4Fe4S-binding SPASM domain
MCPRDKLTHKIGIMDFLLFQKIIDECAMYRELKEVHLHGYGECLLEKDFYRKVSYSKKKNIKTTYIVTNGSLLNDDISKDLINSGLDKIKISFYGATKQTYENVHIDLKFDEVEKNILGLFEMRDKLKRKNPSIFLQFLPLGENIHERNLFFEKWKDIINKDNRDSLLEYCLHNYGVGKKYFTVWSDKTDKRGCALPFSTMQILWNGDVVPCCYDFNGDLSLGNIKEQTIKDTWNSSLFVNLRKAHHTLDFATVPLCGQCDQIVIKKSKKK